MGVDDTTVEETGRSDATKANVNWEEDKRRLTFSVRRDFVLQFTKASYCQPKLLRVCRIQRHLNRLSVALRLLPNILFDMMLSLQYDNAIVFSDDINICFNATIDKDKKLPTGSRLVHATVLMDLLWNRAEFGHGSYPTVTDQSHNLDTFMDEFDFYVPGRFLNFSNSDFLSRIFEYLGFMWSFLFFPVHIDCNELLNIQPCQVTLQPSGEELDPTNPAHPRFGGWPLEQTVQVHKLRMTKDNSLFSADNYLITSQFTLMDLTWKNLDHFSRHTQIIFFR